MFWKVTHRNCDSKIPGAPRLCDRPPWLCVLRPIALVCQVTGGVGKSRSAWKWVLALTGSDRCVVSDDSVWLGGFPMDRFDRRGLFVDVQGVPGSTSLRGPSFPGRLEGSPGSAKHHFMLQNALFSNCLGPREATMHGCFSMGRSLYDCIVAPSEGTPSCMMLVYDDGC
jgi:hypothetical protein